MCKEAAFVNPTIIGLYRRIFPGDKIAEDRVEDITPCIYCNEGCFGNMFKTWNIQCHVNVALGRERDFQIVPAEEKKKVLIVGGGPAGMEAARVLALRGHRVSLYEKGTQLGGQLLAGSVAEHKKPIKDLSTYLKTQLKKLKVKVNLDTEATPEVIKKAKADALLIATGSVPIIPDIAGVDGKSVVLATDVLLGKKKVGDTVAVIGGSDTGVEVALFLAQKGKKVHIIEMQSILIPQTNTASRLYLLWMANERGIEALTDTRLKEVKKDCIVVDKADGTIEEIKVDSVVLAVGFKPNRQLAEKLSGVSIPVYELGDCAGIGRIKGAMHGGSTIARRI